MGAAMSQYDTTHEALAASSLREMAQVTAEWELDPERWKQPKDQWPEALEETPDGAYTSSPVQRLSLEMWDREAVKTGRLFSPELLLLLDRLHAVWLKDHDPRALRVQEAIEELEPGYRPLLHVEEGAGPLEVLRPTEHKREQETYDLDQLAQMLLVWKKVLVMLTEVAQHLSTQRELTTHEATSLDRTQQFVTLLEQRVTLMREQQVATLGDLNRTPH